MSYTQRECIIAYLESVGYKFDPYARSLKFTVLAHPNYIHKYYVGRRGACREGRNQKDSRPLNPFIHSKYVSEGKKILKATSS